jgi:hypothetical protein
MRMTYLVLGQERVADSCHEHHGDEQWDERLDGHDNGLCFRRCENGL